MSEAATAASGFDAVVFDTAREYPCSPQIDPFDDVFRGIAITLPDRVGIVLCAADEELPAAVDPQRTRLALCLVVQLPLARLSAFDEPESVVSVVAQRARDGLALCSDLTSGRPRAPLPPSEIPPAEQQSRIARFFYNVNLCEYLRFPPEPARYFVHAAFEEFRTAPVEVELV